MDFGLKGKTALVLASSKGLGKATAMKFAEEGANVMISSRNEEELQKTADEIREKTGANIAYKVCDIMDNEQIVDLVYETGNRFGTIDILVNNAGGPPAGNFDDFADQDWVNAFELTLLSVVRTVRAVLPYMRKQKGGRIVNIASSSFKQPIENLTLSNTFRTGIMGLGKSLSQELAKDNILINTIGPGRIETDRIIELNQKTADSKGISLEEVRAQSEAMIPLGRYGTPEEFANILVFLCSEANTYVTGQAILVDGGLIKAM
ncbi:3-oxoacyl-ACP reductase [Pueribacillus theae]|uniref:3-oxoacyl-ACP reductase n=1 Tax=Pueribacillus theae TaxID=2171751 RepID=A0A2U1JYE2_9BACI|nr:SDR family oxidoreductase [Pueribacillus theae]PWA10005.1 3-oxoacyl-ACP reductase [Pueribacillus theae]